MNPYESPRLVAEYLLLHYGKAADVLGEFSGPPEGIDFPARLVRELLSPCSPDARALDLGCAVGASSFELARSCREIVGVDFSHAFVAAAERMRRTGAHDFEKIVEGTITAHATVHIPEGIDPGRVQFQQGDAQSLPEEFSGFDIVLAANLICRLPEPMRLVERLPSLVKPRGQLLLTTPFTWLEDYTAREKWLGGTPETGRGIDALRALLDPHFVLEHSANLPFLIREHSRKFQYGVSLGTRWRRR